MLVPKDLLCKLNEFSPEAAQYLVDGFPHLARIAVSKRAYTMGSTAVDTETAIDLRKELDVICDKVVNH